MTKFQPTIRFGSSRARFSLGCLSFLPSLILAAAELPTEPEFAHRPQALNSTNGMILIKVVIKEVPEGARKKAQVLSAPHIQVLEGQKAKLFIGENVPMVENAGSEDSIELGIALEVTAATETKGVRLKGVTRFCELEKSKHRKKGGALSSLLGISKPQEGFYLNEEDQTWACSVDAAELHFNVLYRNNRPVILERGFPNQPKTFLEIELAAEKIK